MLSSIKEDNEDFLDNRLPNFRRIIFLISMTLVVERMIGYNLAKPVSDING